MSLKLLHKIMLVLVVLAILEKLIYMFKVGSWAKPDQSLEGLLFGLGFVFWNISAFLPLLFFARKSYTRLWLFVVDLICYLFILAISLETDWEMHTGTDAQTALVYIVSPMLQWGAGVVLIVVHASHALMSRKTGNQSPDNSAL